jgi:hypothetical protein
MELPDASDVEVPAKEDLPRPEDFKHASWYTLIATAVSYGLVLAGIFVLLFLVPFLLFTLL